MVHGIDEDPVATWTRLKEKIERRSEAEAKASFMLFLDFAHLESETANEMIERYETALQNCLDQGVTVDVNMRQRMLIGDTSGVSHQARSLTRGFQTLSLE